MTVNSILKAPGVLVGSALLLAALIVIPSLWSFGRIMEAGAARQSSHAAIVRGDELLSALREAEIGQRAYSRTGETAFLEPYLQVKDKAPGLLDELRLATPNPESRSHLDALAPLVEQEMAEMSAALAQRSTGRDGRLMEAIQAEVDGFTRAEEAALARSEAKFQFLPDPDVQEERPVVLPQEPAAKL